ncbi:hypothetical protein FEP58_05940 [Burkholderia multivorans]|nr:hypothetical protein [Burkholderia multivorans]
MRAAAMRLVQRGPVERDRAPCVGDLAQHGEPHARVFAALVVVRRGRDERVRRTVRAPPVARMERAARQTEIAGIGADFVARQQPSIAVVRRILDALRGERRRELRERDARRMPARRIGTRRARARQAEPLRDAFERDAIGRIDGRAGARIRLREHAAIVGREFVVGRIHAVHAQVHREFAEHAMDRDPADVACRGRRARDVVQLARDARMFAGELAQQHAALAVDRFLRERARRARHGRPVRAERFRAGRIVQQRGDVVHEVVAGRAVDRPVGAQRFAGREDLLDVDRRRRVALRGEARMQPPAVRARIGEPVDVIDAYAVDESRRMEPQRQRMDRVEHRVVLDAYAGQRRDVEEAPPVELVGGRAPPREPVVLPFEHMVQARARARTARIGAVQHRVERMRAVRGRVRTQRRMRGGDARTAARGRGIEAFGERVQVRAVRDTQDFRIGRDRDRQLPSRAGDREAPGRRVDAERDVAGGERVAVRRAEAGQQHLAVERRVGRMPVDVEIARIRARGAPLEHVVPPAVRRAAHTHVVRHDVDDHAQPARAAPRRAARSPLRRRVPG